MASLGRCRDSFNIPSSLINTGLSLKLQVTEGRWGTEQLAIGSSFVFIFLSICLIPQESKFIILSIVRGSQGECDFALVINLSRYHFGIWSCLATMS